jgi:hypothetical protein
MLRLDVLTPDLLLRPNLLLPRLRLLLPGLRLRPDLLLPSLSLDVLLRLGLRVVLLSRLRALTLPGVVLLVVVVRMMPIAILRRCGDGNGRGERKG